MKHANEWQDWLSDGLYRVRVARPALFKLRGLPEVAQERLKQMLIDIAGLADSQPPSASGRGWRDGRSQLLQLSLGRVAVHYSIDEESRTLTVEHIVVLGDTGSQDRTG